MFFRIDKRQIKDEIRQPNAKTQDAKDNQIVYEGFKHSMWNLLEDLQKSKNYNLGQWVLSTERWLANQYQDNGVSLKFGDIVSLDLGAANYKTEPSFEHPAIVLVSDAKTMFIAPCSSKAYGHGYQGVIDAVPEDTNGGFNQNTGIQMKSLRWVHKNRIITKLGKVTNPVLLESIQEQVLIFFPQIKQKMIHLQEQLEQRDKDLIEKDKVLMQKEDTIKLLLEKVRRIEKEKDRYSRNLQVANAAVQVYREKYPEIEVAKLDEEAGA